MGLPTGGDGGARLYWDATNRQWVAQTGGSNRLTVGDGTTSITNNLSVTGDVTLPGGVPQTFMFYKGAALQGDAVQMSASEATGQVYTRYPMMRSGSILGIALYSEDGAVDDSSNGALTASVTLDGANVSATVIMTTGSIGGNFYTKDTSGLTFNGFQALGVSLTASSDYLNSVAASASWIASVLVEY